jgi:hypothetical protein
MNKIFSHQDKASAKALILEKLNIKNLQDDFLVNDKNEKTTIFFSEKDAKAINKLAPFGFFKTEEDAEDTLLNTLLDNIDVISDWLVSSDSNLTITSQFNKHVGFVFDKNENAVPSNTAIAFLKKSKNELSTLGFYVINFTPN